MLMMLVFTMRICKFWQWYKALAGHRLLYIRDDMEGNITFENGKWSVPDSPRILFAYGDGIGPEIMAVAKNVVDAAAEKAYKGSKHIEWNLKAMVPRDRQNGIRNPWSG